MNKQTFKKVCYGLAALAITACVEEDFTDGLPMEVEVTADIEAPTTFSSSLDIDVPKTRTYIDESLTTSSGVGTKWRTKEKIGVYNSSGSLKNVEFTSSNSKSAASVSFSGFMLGTPKYAYYPYSENNDGSAVTSVKGELPIMREYSTSYMDLIGDYRAGELDSRSWFTSTFTFNRLVSVLKFSVDASGTVLEGTNIHSISMKVSNQRKISGNFTMNLKTQQLNAGNFEEGNDSLFVKFTNEPTLSSGVSRVAYATAIPSVKSGDEITLIITSDKHVTTIKTTSTTNFAPNGLYSYTLVLNNLGDIEIEEIGGTEDKEESEEQPTSDLQILSMKFEASLNPGKILTRKITFNESTFKASYKDEDVATYAEECTIDQENKKITLNLAYLNNRNLIPTITVTEGAMVAIPNCLVESGVTEVDFFNNKQLVVGNEAGDITFYDVELTNSGLPVVVINQKTGVSHNETNSDYSKGSAAWYAATGTDWLAKSADWETTDVTTDNFMVYRPDGSSGLYDQYGYALESPVQSSTRVRGNVTQQMPKKAFAVKLKSKANALKMSNHKRWVLLANWKDRTLMRNEVAFGLAKVFKETFPNDGMEWNPSGQHVELVYNGVHVGNYYLCEQIKIDGDRLDINDPYEDSESTNPADWGYLFELDDAFDEEENGQFMSKHYIPFLPKDANSTDGLGYAKKIIYDVEDNLYNQKYDAAFGTFDLTSAIDYWLIQELMMNSETQHPKSVYMYINDGKLFTGPLWDFDWNTLPISSSYSENGYTYTTSILADAKHYRKSGSGYPSGPYESSSLFSTTTDKNYIWYPMLVKSTTFKEKAKERWDKVKPALIAYANTLPTIAEKLADSERVNYSMWRVDTKSEFKRPSLYNIGHTFDRNSGGYCGDEGMSFKDAVQELSDNLIERINGMDNFVSSTSWPNISIQSSNK